MESQGTCADEANILCQMVYGHVIYEVGKIAIEMGVFETLSEGGATCQSLAEKFSMSEVHLEKLLNSLCALKLLKKTKTKENDIYENMQVASEYLVMDSPESIVGVIKMSEHFKVDKKKMMECLKNGEHILSNEENIFNKMEHNEVACTNFHTAMESIAKTSYSLIKAIDFGQYKTLVDLGGSTGMIARQLAEDYPELDITVLDLPAVIDLASTLPANSNNRVKFVSGDIFKDDLPEADIYTLCHILLDWNDSSCDIILSKIYKHLKPGGAILILDSILNEDKVGPLYLNIREMMLFTRFQGKQRSFSEFENLLAKNGFTNIKLYRANKFCLYDGILARKN